MVARITIPASIRKALNYNEQKVKQGKAICLHAANFLKEPAQMNFHEKLQRFEKQISLNERAKTNSIHISLNFSPEEKLSKENMLDIAESYMNKIGFSQQPFLVYQHTDAGHPHLHIVSTNIQKDGKRISLHNLGKEKSSTAREEIEEQFGLIKARAQQKENSQLELIQAQKIQYGKSPTRQQLSNIVSAVTRQYIFSSLTELNAILNLYNVAADRGTEGGLMFNKKGLRYCTLDKNGMKIGIPLKASLLAGKPTLQFLEKRFTENISKKIVHKRSLKTRIDWILQKNHVQLESLQKELEKENIILVIRRNDSLRVYGLTYIDLKNKTVFNGSDLGKKYAANAVTARLGMHQNEPVTNLQLNTASFTESITPFQPAASQQSALADLIAGLLESQPDYFFLPFQFRKKDKKKRKY